MNKVKRAIIAATLAIGIGLTGAACSSDADVASDNLSKDADNFKVARRVVFLNGITGEYLLEIRGYCSLGNDDPEYRLSVTCKTDGGFKKHFLGLSDNVTYFAEQLDAQAVSTQHYTVIFKPSVIIPAPELR